MPAAPSISARGIFLHHAVAGPNLVEKLLRGAARPVHGADLCVVDGETVKFAKPYADVGSGGCLGYSELDPGQPLEPRCTLFLCALSILDGFACGNDDCGVLVATICRLQTYTIAYAK